MLYYVFSTDGYFIVVDDLIGNSIFNFGLLENEEYIFVKEDFRYMKIHIFALRWKDEIRRSSQLRTLLKRIVVNRT